MTDVTVLEPSAELRLHRLTGAFLAGYRNANTRSSYLQQLHRWFAWCTAHQLDPLDVERTHVELYLRWFERQVGSIIRSTRWRACCCSTGCGSRRPAASASTISPRSAGITP